MFVKCALFHEFSLLIRSCCCFIVTSFLWSTSYFQGKLYVKQNLTFTNVNVEKVQLTCFASVKFLSSE